MKTVNLLKITITAILLGGFTITTIAQGRSDRQRAGKFMQLCQNPDMARGQMQIPDLTAEQKEQIRSIMLNTRKQMIPLQNQMREKRARLRTLSTGEAVDTKAANTIIEEIGTLRTTMMKNRFAARQDIRTLLTADQRIWLDSRPCPNMNNRKARFKNW